MLYCATLLFVAANLTVGITLSSLAGNQLQAMQMTMFLFSAEHAAFRVHVSVSGHAAVGAICRQSPAAYLLQSPDTRHFPERQRILGPLAESLAAHDLYPHRDGDRGKVLPENAGLKPQQSAQNTICCLSLKHAKQGKTVTKEQQRQKSEQETEKPHDVSVCGSLQKCF